MEIINFSSLESHVLDTFNKGAKTFEAVSEAVSINEKTLNTIIEGLISKNILKINSKTNEFEYQTKVDGEIVILDGNLLLPTTIIKLEKEILVCRGEWYSFPLDFDVRRIIWNVKLDSKTNSTLVDLIRTSILKEKKSKIVQLPEHQNLVNKIVPYSKKLGLLINCVGEFVTDVTIQFKIKINQDQDISVEHKGFNVRTEISTEELISQIKLPVNERNYPENIKLNKIYELNEFLSSKNEIPISLINNELTYVKITGVKKGYELTYYKMNSIGSSVKFDTETFEDNNEAIEKLRDFFRGLPNIILSENQFLCELTE